jgi:hypothetical protein
MEKSTHFGGTPSVHSEITSQLDSVSYNQDIERKSGEAMQEIKTKDPNVVDWDGPDDPANPMNWSSKKKVAAIGIVSLITMLS